MKVNFYLRDNNESLNVKNKLIKIFSEKVSKFEEVEKNPDLIVAIGGDGTILRSISDNYNNIEHTKFVGIMTGTLGFYSDFSKDKLEYFVDMICNEDYKIEEKHIMEFETCVGEECYSGFALNEITLINPYSTQIMDIYIDGEYFYTSRGTGICVSTSTGSTAFNKSLGGAVVDTNLKLLQITEMASINSNVYKSLNSPLILSEDREVVIKSPAPFDNVTFTADARHEKVNGYSYVKCKSSKKTVKFITKNDFDFIARVKKAFL